MSSATRVEVPDDAELISAVRGGDLDAYGDLFERHVEAARRLARQLVSPGDVEDLVSEAFVKVLGILQRGGGPDAAFRAYLLTSVRSLRVDKFRAGARLHTTDDMEAFDPGVPFRDTAIEGFESTAAAKAFASLPERWQLVLWHTEVEGDRPADIAPLLGMSANSVSALAYRAREGLRQAFLTEHANELDEDDCRWTHEHLGAYIRNGTSRRDASKVEDHLGQCRSCMAIYLELTEVNSNLGALLAPLLLGGAAAAYTSTTGGVVVPMGIGLVVGRVRDAVAGNSAAVAVAGVAASLAVVGATLAVTSNGRDRVPVEPPIAAVGLPGAASDDPSDASTTAPRRGAGSRDPFVITPGETLVVEIADTLEPTPALVPAVELLPTSSPTQSPTEDENPTPTATPTVTPTATPTATATATPTVTPTSTHARHVARNADAYTDADSHGHTDRHTDGHPHRDAHRHTDGHPHRDAHRHPDRHPDRHPHRDAHRDAHLDADPGRRVRDRPGGRRRVPSTTIVVQVAGLPTDREAVLSVWGSTLVVLSTTDDRCTDIARVVTCAISGADLTPVTLRAIVPRASTIEAEVRVTESDPDLDNNVWRALLD